MTAIACCLSALCTIAFLGLVTLSGVLKALERIAAAMERDDGDDNGGDDKEPPEAEQVFTTQWQRPVWRAKEQR